MIKQILEIAKFSDDEKIGVSFQMPKSLKSDLEQYCKEHNIKMTTFFNAMAQIVLSNDNYSLECQRLLQLRLEHIEDKLSYYKENGFSDKDEIMDYELLLNEKMRLESVKKYL